MYLDIYWSKLYHSYSIGNLLQLLFCDATKRVVLTQIILHQSWVKSMSRAYYIPENLARQVDTQDTLTA